MTYISYRNLALTFLCIYALIGAGAHLTRTSTEDVYPFFSWSLFVQVPPREQDAFVALVVADGGERLETPVPLAHFSGFSMEGLNTSTLGAHIHQLGHALGTTDTAKAAKLQRALDERFARPVTYAIVHERFHPMEKFLFGSVSTSTVVRIFEVPLQP